MSQSERDARLAAEKAAMQNCENDVNHDVGAIQPFGYLLALDPERGRVTHASENVAAWYQRPLADILGAPAEAILPQEVVHQCNNALGHSTIETQREHVGLVARGDALCDVLAHRKQARLILEFQPTGPQTVNGLAMLNRVQRMLERLATLDTEEALLEQVVDELRALVGFHRVKAYRFLADGGGEVVAESREPQVDSFLGLRFPPQDVPQAARQLYATTPLRIIPSVRAEPVKIRAAGAQEAALNLSLALFRGVVPVHVLYLQNMGVRATLSVPIIVDGEMWGLFACHHREERMLDSATLTAVEILGGSVSMLLQAVLQRRRRARLEACTQVVGALFVPDESALGFSSYWDTASAELAALIPCDGVGLLSEGCFDHYGACPPAPVVRQLAAQLEADFRSDRAPLAPIALDTLDTAFPGLDCGETAGVLAIPEPAPSYQYLLYFRRRASRTVRWAGKPTKEIAAAQEGFRLHPRASFAAYVETRQQYSDAFDDDDLSVAAALRDALSRTVSTVTVQRQHRERLGLVVRELNHRVRNILALVGSIVSQARGTAHDVEAFVQALEHRIQALSETHKLLTEFDWRPIDMRLLCERALLAYRAHVPVRLTLEGEALALPPELASLLALVLHELASNAAKYGALSGLSGHVQLRWSCPAEVLTITWQETGGPPVERPQRQGFGTSLIKEALAYEFDASCQLDFLPAGVQARFTIPYQRLGRELERGTAAEESEAVPFTPPPFVALLLEDDYILAREMAQTLEKLGAVQVDTAPTVARALECLARTAYDFALLDANVRGQFSGKVAELLHAQGVPFAFATGYGSRDQALQNMPCVAVMSKPVTTQQVRAALQLAHVIPSHEQD